MWPRWRIRSTPAKAVNTSGGRLAPSSRWLWSSLMSPMRRAVTRVTPAIRLVSRSSASDMALGPPGSPLAAVLGELAQRYELQVRRQRRELGALKSIGARLLNQALHHAVTGDHPI